MSKKFRRSAVALVLAATMVLSSQGVLTAFADTTPSAEVSAESAYKQIVDEGNDDELTIGQSGENENQSENSSPSTSTADNSAAVVEQITSLPTTDDLANYTPAIELKPEDEGYQEAYQAALDAYYSQVQEQVKAARAAYDALTEEEKAAFDATVLAKLESLENLFTMREQVNTLPEDAEPKTITVPGDYTTLQEAVENANSGDTVQLTADSSDSIDFNISEDHYSLTIDLNGHMMNGTGTSKVAIEFSNSNYESPTLTIKGGTISNYTNPIKQGGAAIRTENLNLTVENCKFIGNNSDAGSAIWSHNDTGSPKVSITNCEFSNNIATSQGGALSVARDYYAESPYVEVSITNSSFTENVATEFNGGAIYFSRANGTFNGVTFTKNYTSDNVNNPYQMGGAIYVDNATTLQITGGGFFENSSKYGGAIAVTTNSNGNFNNVSMSNNSAVTGGGAIYADTNVTLTNGNLTENTSGNYGGAIYIANGSLTVNDTEISKNKSSSGGAIYTYQNSATIHTSLTNNTSSGSGGALYAKLSTVEFTGDITDNTASSNGGAIFATQSNVTVNGNLMDNSASKDGGAIHGRWSNVNVTGTITHNEAANGGGIYFFTNVSGEQYDGSLDITDADVYNNTASNSAADIFLGENNHMQLNAVDENWTLEACGDTITGWFDDSEGNRWEAHNDPKHAEELTDFENGVDGELSLIAAHSYTSSGTDPNPTPDPDPTPDRPSRPDRDDDDDWEPLPDAPVKDKPEKVEVETEVPEETETPTTEQPEKHNPETGDTTTVFAAMALAAVSLGGVVLLGRKKR